MILLITGWFYNRTEGSSKGQKEFLVSHGIDLETDQVVILPNEHPKNLGAILDVNSGEWVIA